MPDEIENQKKALELEQLELTNRKIDAELKKLERDNEPDKWWPSLLKNVIAFGGVLTVAATAYGIWDSYNKTIIDRDKARQFDQQTNFEQALKRLKSPSTMSKLVGVSLLANYLNEKDQRFHRQILFAFSSLIATEHDVQAQASIRDVITTSSKTSVTDEDWSYFASILVSMNRALASKIDKYNHRSDQDDKASADDEKSLKFLAQAVSALGRRGALQKIKDYDGVYCGDCDFRGAAFQEGTHFEKAILDRSNFQNATLRNSKFKNTRMNGTIFVETDLDGAVFENSEFRTLPGGATIEINVKNPSDQSAKIETQVLESDGESSLSYPKFNCASLKGAQFTKVPFFTVNSYYAGSKPQPQPDIKPGYDVRKYKHTGIDLEGANFHNAELSHAHLEEVRFLEITKYGATGTGIATADGTGVGNSTVWVGMPDFDFVKDDKGENSNGLVKRSVRGALYETRIDGIQLPEYIAKVLAEKAPSKGDYDPPRLLGASFGNVDRYSDCKPRNTASTQSPSSK